MIITKHCTICDYDVTVSLFLLQGAALEKYAKCKRNLK